MTKFLFDTNVLLDYLRGHPKAAPYVEAVLNGSEKGYLSVISLVELGRAIRDSEEGLMIDGLTSKFEIVPLTLEIATLARGLVNQRLPVADALIAATAIKLEATILTADKALQSKFGSLASYLVYR